MATQQHPLLRHDDDADSKTIARLTLSGIEYQIGFEEAGKEETIFMVVDRGDRNYMSPCETHLLIAALGTALCQTMGKDEA